MIFVCLLAIFLATDACMDTGKSSETTELWNEIQNLRTLLKQERNLRLSFEQTQLNTLSELTLGTRCNETQVYSNTVMVKTLEQRLNMINSTIESIETGCISGNLSVWDHPIQPTWPVTKDIIFNPPFMKTPVIDTGMTLLDSEHDTNVRAVIETENITQHGFTLILRNYGDTEQWALGANWMACPSR